ncbi:MAG: hypothetical protein ABWY96_11610 [Gaiellaceae bacterium]
MRALALATCLLLLAAGCGGRETRSGSSTAADEPPSTSISESEQLPPPFALVTGGGRQNAVQGSYCLALPEVGKCADYMQLPPAELSIVAPGETVTLVLDGALTVDGRVVVLPLGCSQKVSSVVVDAPDTTWQVDLDPGLYELELFARFEATAKSGDTSASLGLQVDLAADAAIVPVPDPLPACPDGQSRYSR